MAEEVRIVVKQESQGNALSENAQKIEQLKAKIAELNRLEKSYTEKGMSTAATSTRTERIPYARELRDLQREERATSAVAKGSEKEREAKEAAAAAEAQLAAKRQAAADALRALEMRASGDVKGAEALERQNAIRERAIQIERELLVSRARATELATREIAAQQKIVAAMPAQGVGAAAWARGSMAAGIAPGPLSGLAGLGLSGPQAAVVAGAAVAGMLASALVRVQDEIAAAQGRSVVSGARRARIAGRSGAEAQQEAASEALDNQRALAEAIGKRGSFRDTGVLNFLKRNVGLGRFTDSYIAERENELEIARLQKETPQAQKLAVDKFSAGPGGKELERSRALIDKDQARARQLQDTISWEKEYQRVIEQTGKSEEGRALASESASNKVFLEQRSRSQEFAKLISARSGAGDIARAGSLASSQSSVGALRGAIDGLHETVRTNHREGLTAATARTFASKPYYQ